MLEDSSGIGTREGWAKRLKERGFCLKGQRLVKCSPANRASEEGESGPAAAIGAAPEVTSEIPSFNNEEAPGLNTPG